MGLFLLLVSCQLPQLRREAPELNEVVAGEKFRINLPENHSTGYLWQLNQDYDHTLIRDLGAVWHGNEKGLDLNFQALGVGQVTLDFTLRKYTDTSENKTFIIKIVQN